MSGESEESKSDACGSDRDGEDVMRSSSSSECDDGDDEACSGDESDEAVSMGVRACVCVCVYLTLFSVPISNKRVATREICFLQITRVNHCPLLGVLSVEQPSQQCKYFDL